MKKTIIICSAIMLVSIAGLGVFLVLYNNATQQDGTQMMNQSLLNTVLEYESFEALQETFQENLSEEALTEAENVYNQIIEAQESGDQDTLQNLLIELNSLGLFAEDSEWGEMGGQDSGFSITDLTGSSSGGDMPSGGGGDMPSGGGNMGGGPGGN